MIVDATFIARLEPDDDPLALPDGIRLAVETARAADPRVRLVLNDFDLSPAFEEVIEECLDAGVEIALASNCNPGTSYTSSMNFNVGTAVLQMHLSLVEAVRAATLGAAVALRVQDSVGSIEVGKRADLHLLNAPAAIHLAYRPGMPLTHAVWRRGQRQV